MDVKELRLEIRNAPVDKSWKSTKVRRWNKYRRRVSRKLREHDDKFRKVEDDGISELG